MKRSIILVMALAITAGLFFGCGGNDNKAEDDASTEESRITVVSREDGSGTRGAFIELAGIIKEGSDGSKKDLTTKEAIIANKTDVMLTNIASDPNAVGYVSLGSLNDSVKALAIDGVECTFENVKNEEYKISRPFNIATKGDASGLAKDFIDFIMSKEGQEVIKDGYIPVNDDAATFAGEKPTGKIVVAGSSSVTPIMEKLKEAYIKQNPNAEIEIQMSDSTAGVTAAMTGTCDIGMASRELKETELSELKGITIAMDGIAVIVNPENKLEGLTLDQVANIFKGEVTTWESLDE